MVSEEWRAIPGYPDYQASSYGRIRSLKRATARVLSPSLNKGYLHVCPCYGGRATSAPVNRLVCLAFHGAPPGPEYEAAHSDGNRGHNTPENLVWKTSKDNHADRVQHGTDAKGSRNGRAVLTEEDVNFVLSVYIPGTGRRNPGNSRLLAGIFGVAQSAIQRIARGDTWSHV